jgi:hypothetical protein
VVHHVVQALRDGVVMYFNGKLASAVEATRRQVDGANNGALVIRKDEFCVQFKVL